MYSCWYLNSLHYWRVQVLQVSLNNFYAEHFQKCLTQKNVHHFAANIPDLSRYLPIQEPLSGVVSTINVNVHIGNVYEAAKDIKGSNWMKKYVWLMKLHYIFDPIKNSSYFFTCDPNNSWFIFIETVLLNLICIIVYKHTTYLL